MTHIYETRESARDDAGPLDDDDTAAAAAAPTLDESGLSDDQIREIRYAAKTEPSGAAVAPERDDLYRDLTDVGDSGSQGGLTGREDQNPIGPNKRQPG